MNLKPMGILWLNNHMERKLILPIPQNPPHMEIYLCLFSLCVVWRDMLFKSAHYWTACVKMMSLRRLHRIKIICRSLTTKDHITQALVYRWLNSTIQMIYMTPVVAEVALNSLTSEVVAPYHSFIHKSRGVT